MCLGFGLRTHVLSITVRHRLEHPSLEFAITFTVASSVKIGTIQRRLAWPLRKDDTHKSAQLPERECRTDDDDADDGVDDDGVDDDGSAGRLHGWEPSPPKGSLPVGKVQGSLPE